MSSVVISLDFELRWGVADKLGTDASAYRDHLEGEADAVHAMLEYFGEQGIGATWATVGALACADWEEYFDRAPAAPNYTDPKLRFCREWAEMDPSGRIHFAPDSVAAIAAAPRQELASHTFSHIYLREPGCTREDVRSDALAVARCFQERLGKVPTSFVFPRNQVAQTDALQEAGIERWRNNPHAFYWKATRRSEQSRIARGMRMLESLAPIGSRRAPSREMRASYLVRYALPDWAWKLHVRRIAADARGLRRGEALHLWWHPHNMGAAVQANLKRLSELVDTIRDVAPEGTRFTTMAESGHEGADEKIPSGDSHSAL